MKQYNRGNAASFIILVLVVLLAGCAYVVYQQTHKKLPPKFTPQEQPEPVSLNVPTISESATSTATSSSSQSHVATSTSQNTPVAPRQTSFSKTTPSNVDGFTHCLAESGADFYGTFWCPYCDQQRKLLNLDLNTLPYNECSTPDGTGVNELCKSLEIAAYPTWIFNDGSQLTGQLSLQQLSEKTQCPIPSDATSIPTIAIITPNGGETLLAGASHQIKWESYGDIPIVDITIDNPLNVYIASSIQNTGTYLWNIPAGFTPGQYKIRITPPTGDSTRPWDESDSPFTVVNKNQ